MDTIAAYLIFLNLVGFLIMGEDKRRAKMHRWRISERMLFLVSILGGSIGTWAGMYVFRHKTRHWYFVIGMPLILILQIAGTIWLYRQGLYYFYLFDITILAFGIAKKRKVIYNDKHSKRQVFFVERHIDQTAKKGRITEYVYTGRYSGS